MATIAAMLVIARESRGWTQKDLARAIGIKQATISKYEIGALAIPDRHIESICRFLNYEPELLEQSEALVGLGGDLLYRKRAALTAKAQRRVEAEANIRKIQVVRLLRGALVDTELPFPVIPLKEVEGSPDLAAQEARRALRIPRGPIRQSLTRILENAGAIVFTVDFGTDFIDGTNIRVPGIPPLLFLNKHVQGERHRFNLAHELGHAVMHFGVVHGDAEVQANRFANEFLMPKADIRSDLRNLDLASAMRLKSVWGVSMAAIIHWAHQLEILGDAKYRRLFTQLGAGGMRTREPNELEFENPETFDRLVQVHRDKLGFSQEEIRKLLFSDRLGEIPVPEEQPHLRLAGGLFD